MYTAYELKVTLHHCWTSLTAPEVETFHVYPRFATPSEVCYWCCIWTTSSLVMLPIACVIHHSTIDAFNPQQDFFLQLESNLNHDSELSFLFWVIPGIPKYQKIAVQGMIHTVKCLIDAHAQLEAPPSFVWCKCEMISCSTDSFDKFGLKKPEI